MLPCAIDISGYVPDDAPVVAAIYAPYVSDSTVSFELDPPSADEMGRRLDALVAAEYPQRERAWVLGRSRIRRAHDDLQ